MGQNYSREDQLNFKFLEISEIVRQDYDNQGNLTQEQQGNILIETFLKFYEYIIETHRKVDKNIMDEYFPNGFQEETVRVLLNNALKCVENVCDPLVTRIALGNAILYEQYRQKVFEVKREIYRLYNIDLEYYRNLLEGSNLPSDETRLLIERNNRILREERDKLNRARHINYMLKEKLSNSQN